VICDWWGAARQSLDQKSTENLTQSRKGKNEDWIAAKTHKTHKKEDFKSVKRGCHTTVVLRLSFFELFAAISVFCLLCASASLREIFLCFLVEAAEPGVALRWY
jgi:hypothetical protein